MLKNRKIASIITAALMVMSVFLGAWTSYNSMRSDAQVAFDTEIIPLIHEAMVPAFNMQTVAQNYLSQSDMNNIPIGRIVGDIQNTDNAADIYNLFVQLNRGVWAIYDRLENVDMSDVNRNFITGFHTDFMELDWIISRSVYNNIAEEFNTSLGSNLGFLVRPFMGEMPRFD